jgi:hypothetical protein
MTFAAVGPFGQMQSDNTTMPVPAASADDSAKTVRYNCTTYRDCWLCFGELDESSAALVLLSGVQSSAGPTWLCFDL